VILLRKQAFTIIELMLAMALVLVVMLVISQIMRSTQIVTSASRRHLDADSEARTVFDRMDADFSRMVKRTDVDFLIDKGETNDSVYFYSEAPSVQAGLATTNSVALIGYRVNPESHQLERFSLGLAYTNSSSNNMVFLNYTNAPSTTNAPVPSSTLSVVFSNAISLPGNYQVIAPDVFRLELSFLLKPYTDSTTMGPKPSYYSVAPFNPSVLGRSDTNQIFSTMENSASYGNWGEIGWGDVQAVVVTLAILDESTQKALPNLTNALISMSQTNSQVLPKADPSFLASNPPVLPAQMWQTNIDSGSYIKGVKVPRAVVNQVRVYQRVFPIN